MFSGSGGASLVVNEFDIKQVFGFLKKIHLLSVVLGKMVLRYNEIAIAL